MKRLITIIGILSTLLVNMNITPILAIEPDYPEFKKIELSDPLVAYQKAEEERIKAEEEAKAALKDALFINFDEYFKAINVDKDPNAQAYIDANMMTMYWNDWYHHCTSAFMSLFNQLDAGDACQINGITYTVVRISHGTIYGNSVYDDYTGATLHDNGTVEILTCDSTDSSIYRWIAYLE